MCGVLNIIDDVGKLIISGKWFYLWFYFSPAAFAIIKIQRLQCNSLKSLLSNAEGIIPSDSDLLRPEELFRKVWECLSESGKALLK